MKKRSKKDNCQFIGACPIEHTLNCENPVICPRCASPMGLFNCFIPKEEMHFNHHTEACSEWVCVCGYSGFRGVITGKLYPYKKIVIEKG
ncbi:hypothetical protein KAU32_00895 [bacterium]|nr:hypothetical protein [bacterium]